jgi:hypothetical protein
MLIASFCLGDLLVTLVKSIPLNKNNKQSFNLNITDIATDEQYTHVIDNENAAVYYFAAFLVSDSPKDIVDYVMTLRNTSASRFMP